MKEVFYLTINQREHVLRHFHSKELAGSHFHETVFETPEDLITYINSNEPSKTFQQSPQRKAYCFIQIELKAVGTSGIARRCDLRKEQITRHVREGYSIDIGLVDQLPETNEFCVIADTTPNGLSIITAFPGGYARPFAQKGQPPNDYMLNKKFWEEHVLLKSRKSDL
jgi:hypothetical protein